MTYCHFFLSAKLMQQFVRNIALCGIQTELCVGNDDETVFAKMPHADALKPSGSIGAPIFVPQIRFNAKYFFNFLSNVVPQMDNIYLHKPQEQ